MSEISQTILQTSFDEIGEIIRSHQSFIIMSHVRPDGDAIGSQLALGCSLLAANKTVRMIHQDGVPENLAFMAGAELIEPPPSEPILADVAIALDTAAKPRLGDAVIHAASKAKIWLNIDHHVSNPGYGDLNRIDPTSPATGQIIYQLITSQKLPLPAASRDAIYIAVSTDTGSFQYPSTSAETYELAADLVRRGLEVGKINTQLYDSYPFRRIELMRRLLNSLERHADGRIAAWEMRDQTRVELELVPDDSEGLIDLIRAIRGVEVAVFFEELPEGKIRVSMRSKNPLYNVCEIAVALGGGGHALAAGIRMAGPLEIAKKLVLDAIKNQLAKI